MVLSSEKNLYEILEINYSASSITIKSAYRKLARKYHPDLNGGDEFCVAKFKEITEAYEILSNSEKKKNYDIRRGFYSETSKAKYSEADRAYKEQKEQKEKKEKEKDVNISNIFNDILEGFKNTTSSAKKQAFKTKQVHPEQGRDVNTEVKITYLEAIQGTNKIVNILHTEICPNCEGRPFLNGAKCPLCNGDGEHTTHKKLNVKIPANVLNGSKIRIANEGNRGYNGGKNGDLYLNIKIEAEPTSKFKYEGLNVLSTIPITTFEAVLGATIEIPAPSGKISMKITPNTQSGQKFRLSGQGLKQNEKIGDMIVTVNIEVPKNPSEKEIELYKELKNITKSDIREKND